MTAKKKKKPPARPAWTPEEASAAAAKLTALVGRCARTTCDVANPCSDKRVRWGSDLDAAPAVIPAGTLVAITRANWGGGVRYGRLMFELALGQTRVAFDGSDGEVLVGGTWGDHDDVGRDLIDALGEPERSWEALCASRESGGLSGWTRRALRHLVESGRLSLEEVEAAAIAEDGEGEGAEG